MRPEADICAFLAVNAAGPVLLVPLMQALSWLGDYHRTALYAAVLLAIALARQRRSDALVARRWFLAGLGMALALPFSVLLTAGLKEVIAAPRPSALLGPDAVLVLGQTDSEYAFPSGHAASVALLAASLWSILPAWGRAVAIMLALAVGASRIWLGMHFPSDVLAGLAIGAAVAVASGLFVRRMFGERP